MDQRRIAPPQRIGYGLLLTLVVLVGGTWLAGVGVLGTARATSTFAAQTGKDCLYCHQGAPGGPLTAEGQAFVDAGYQLPPSTTVPPTAPSTTQSTIPAPDTTSSSAPGDTGTTTASAGGDGGSTTTVLLPPPPAGGGGDGEASGTIVTLPNWLRILLVWAHLVAVVAWLGAIIFVHIVQTPSVAGQGIPPGYLKLAWPSIVTVGLTGTFLTLNTVDTLGVLDETRWGKLLLTKIGLYLLLVAVATVATFVISPRLKRMAERSRQPLDSHGTYKEQGIITVAYQGCVYDVSRSRLWRGGRHAKRHDAWQDLTEALAGAPHGPEVFESFVALEGVAETETPTPLRVFLVLAYGNLVLVAAVLAVVAAW